MTSEEEDNFRLKNAREFLASQREKENQARIQLADAVKDTQRAKEKFETMFAECEARAVRRKRLAS